MFQIFAQLIELHRGELPAFYMASLFQPLLAPVFWERAGNVPALTRLMQVSFAGWLSLMMAAQPVRHSKLMHLVCQASRL